jgi:beta-lactamase regulating signal transducer with metallopeptidase domain/tetratricopeptide (TPR) repeat protein
MGGMLENFQPFMGWLIKTSVQSCVIICLILIIRFLLHKKIAVRWLYILWLLLLVRMMLPALPQTKFSPANYVPETARQVYSEPVKQARAEDIKLPLTAEQPIYSSVASTNQERLSGWPEVNYRNIFAGIWLAGLVFWGLYLIVSNYRLYRSITRQRPLIDEKILNLFEDCKTMMGVNTIVGIVAVDNISSPALFGFVRPRLLLPKPMLSDFSMQDLKYVFLHELAHLKRNDILVSWITSILQIMHWFNPLVWFAFAKMRVDRELACDSLVLSYIKQERSGEYGQSIVNLLEKFSKQRYMPSMAGILEEKHQMKRRIKMIAEFKSKRAKFSILAAVVLSVFAFVAFTSAQEDLENKTPSDNYEQLGRGFLKLLIDEKYDDAVKDFDATVSQQMPATTLKQTWQQILSQAGKFQKELGIRQQQFLASKIVLLTCQFEKGPLDVKVVYDAEKKISGLWFLPTPEDVLKEYNEKAKQLFDEKEKQAYQVSADFSATLSNGTTVELMGVCEQFDKQWWKPDGSLLSEALMDKTNVSIGPEKANYVVVKIDSYDKADGIGFRYSIDGAQNSGSGNVYKDGQSLDGFYSVVFSNPKGDKKTNIRLGIATGKWETLISQKADFSGVYSNKDITWHGPIDNNGKTVLHVAHKFEELNVRIVAVDKNGKEFIGGGGSASKDGIESMQITFDVPVSDIKEFQFQTRPYEWVEFKDVYLKPNTKTDTNAEIKPNSTKIATPEDKAQSQKLNEDGWALWRERNYAQAEEKFLSAVEKDPANTNALNGLGWSQFNQGKPLNAKEAFLKCVELEPTHPAALNGLGWISKNAGQTEQAIGYWEKAVNATPNATAAISGLVQIYEEKKDYKKAVQYYQMWVKAEPDNQQVKEGLEKARKMISSNGNTNQSTAKSTEQLQYDDDKSAGRESINGGTEVVKFETEKCQLLAFRIFGSRYGEDSPPKEDFNIYVYDKDMTLINEFPFPYSRFTKERKDSDGRWVTLKIKPQDVPDVFYVAVDFNAEKTKGVYVHHDGQASGNSFIGSSANPDSLKPFEKGDWMIRAVVKKVLPENPVVLKATPAALSNDVSPDLNQITVQFDRPMGGGCSWTGGGETFPEIIGKPYFDNTATKGIIDVKLKPGQVYLIGVNNPSHQNFRSIDGKPAQRYLILFATKDVNGNPTPIPENMLQEARTINSMNK